MDKLIINGVTYVAVKESSNAEHVQQNKDARKRRSKSRRAHIRNMAVALKAYKLCVENLLNENIELREENSYAYPEKKSWWKYFFK